MVSIIILSYNTKDLLQQCLSSIFATLTGISYEVIVVDNASHDGSTDMVHKTFKQVHVVQNRENTGFAKGCNIGANAAKGEYLLFLNSDTLVEHTDLAKMVGLLDNDSRVGVVGGLLKNPDGSVQRSCGKFYSVWQIFLMLTIGDKGELAMQPKTAGEVDWVSGGFMLVRKALFEKLQGFDEHFFMYVEDMELCYRVKKHRYKVYVLPEVEVTHIGQGSSNRTFAIINIYKGIVYFFKKHKNSVSFVLVKLLLRLKAYSAIGVGRLTHNTYLTKTYREAVQYIV